MKNFKTPIIQGMKTQILLVVKNNTPLLAKEVVIPFRIKQDLKGKVDKNLDIKEEKIIRDRLRMEKRHELIKTLGTELEENGQVYIGRRMAVSNEFQGYPLKDYLEAWEVVDKNKDSTEKKMPPAYKAKSEVVLFVHDVKFR
jgi:hypothetical protein